MSKMMYERFKYEWPTYLSQMCLVVDDMHGLVAPGDVVRGKCS